MSTSTGKSTVKYCFVTIGATASFASLIRAVLSPSFLAGLKAHNYTHLVVQYGADGASLYQAELRKTRETVQHAEVIIEGFPLDQSGLGKYMSLAKNGGDGKGQEGVVVSHAGSGSILDALRMAVPIIVVPNNELLDNHQVELAEALAEQEYVVHGKIDNLSQALAESETLSKRHKEWPPVNSGQHRQAKGLARVIDEEMGFLD
ncbi:hypothetical protein MBLNU457_4061t2 [Dothideomycetes sp. NU457]